MLYFIITVGNKPSLYLLRQRNNKPLCENTLGPKPKHWEQKIEERGNQFERWNMVIIVVLYCVTVTLHLNL